MMDLEQRERRVDLFGEPDVLHQPCDHPHTPMGDRLDALGQLVGDVRPAEQRAVSVHDHRLVEPPRDETLLTCEAPSKLPLVDHTRVYILSVIGCGMLGHGGAA
ncbi:MAG: hypothetical protein ACYCTE_06180 [Acidimicrobiales bacterium]